MKHDYDRTAALFSAAIAGNIPPKNMSTGMVESIHHALKIASKLMQEPSEGMVNQARWVNLDANHNGIWKAMRDEMLREIE